MKQPAKRRAPSQERAQKTRLLILASALRLLEQDGFDNFTTNRLAQLSGFSVGTIYQYFDDKHAILLALARHELQRTMQELRRLLLTDPASEPPDGKSPRARAVVRAILHTFGNRHRAHRILLPMALQGIDPELRNNPVLAPLAGLLTSGRLASQPGVTPALSATDVFVLIQAVMGPINIALLGNARLLRKPQFEDSLTDLIDAFVRRRTGN